MVPGSTGSSCAGVICRSNWKNVTLSTCQYARFLRGFVTERRHAVPACWTVKRILAPIVDDTCVSESWDAPASVANNYDTVMDLRYPVSATTTTTKPHKQKRLSSVRLFEATAMLSEVSSVDVC